MVINYSINIFLLIKYVLVTLASLKSKLHSSPFSLAFEILIVYKSKTKITTPNFFRGN